MLNINAFFEFKQRTRHTHSFQLAQLIYHSQHLNDYHTIPQTVDTNTHRKKSLTALDDPVSILIKKSKEVFEDNPIQTSDFESCSGYKI